MLRFNVRPCWLIIWLLPFLGFNLFVFGDQVTNSASNPWDSDIMLRVSGDGVLFGPETVFSKASGVPSVVRDARGRLIAAFQWFPSNDATNWDRVAAKISEDNGSTWSSPQPIQISGLPEDYSRPFDPALAVLDDGRIRMYFSSNTGGSQQLDSRVATYSAISADGVHYIFEAGRRFGVEGRIVIDPTVLQLAGTWHYIAPIGRPEEGAYHAVSSDGLSFVRVQDVPSVDGVNWTGNLVRFADGMRFYGSSNRGLWWVFSSNGHTWTDPSYVAVQGGDPSVCMTGDGRYLILYVGAPSSSSTIQVETRVSNYRTARYGTAGFFHSAQNADLMLSGVDFNNTGGPLLFNHPAGIGGDGTRIALADRNNNRILIWKSPPQGNAPPDLVLGQPDFIQNNPGSGLHQLNWPCAVSLSANGRIAVADTNNDRLLLWLNFPAANGAPADLEIRLPSLSSGQQPYGWPWGVWTDGQRLAATATHGGAILFWRVFPSRSQQPPDYVVSDPSFGTLRAITSDGTFLIVDDHNARIPGSPNEATSEMATFFWNVFPDNSSSAYTFAMRGVRLRGGLAYGKLVLLGGSSGMSIWSGFPVSASDPPVLSVAGSWNSDGAGLTVAAGTLYTFDENQNKILAYRALPSQARTDADFAVGSPSTSINTLRTSYFIQNPVPVSNGTSLFVSSDYDRKLYVWQRLPDESGAFPDVVYSLPEAPWANALLGNVLVLAGKRTVYVWKQLPLNGNLPALILSNRIGNVSFQEIRGVALDKDYLYISDYQARKVYVWRGLPSATDNPVMSLDTVSQPVRISSDGNHLVITLSGPPPQVRLYRVADLESTPAPIANVTGPGFNLPEGALVVNGSLFVADTVSSRVLGWQRIADAISGKDPDLILGASDLNERSAEIGRDKLFWPGAVSFDGSYLWVGEFKFSSRLLRFSPSTGPFQGNLYLPKLINDASMLVGLGLVNPTAEQVSASLSLYDSSGNLFRAADVSNPATLEIKAGNQLPALVAGIFGNGLNTADGWVHVETSRVGLAGMSLRFEPEVRSLNGTLLSGRLLRNFIVPEAEKAEVSLVNPQAAQAHCTVRLIGNNGNARSTASISIPPRGRVVVTTANLFSGSESQSGYLHFDADHGLGSISEWELGGSYGGSMNPLDPNGGASLLYAPQYAIGGGWQTSVTIINLEEKGTNLTITFYSDSGTVLGRANALPLPPRGRFFLSDPAALGISSTPRSFQGYLKIESDVRMTGFARYSDPRFVRYQAVLPLEDRPRQDFLFSHVASDQFYYTGLAMVSAGGPVTVSITVHDADGAQIRSKTLALAQGGRMAALVDELFPTLPAITRGYIRIHANGAMFAHATFGTRALTALAAVPAQEPENRIASANAWTDLGRVLESSDFGRPAGSIIGDPTGVRLPDGRIRLFVHVDGNGVWRAVSKDASGTSFQVEGRCTLIPDAATNSMGTPWGEPRVVEIPGGLRMFYMQDGGIASATSSDHIVWKQEPGLRISAQQAGMRATTTGTVVKLSDGGYRIYFSQLRNSASDPATAMKSATSPDMLTWTVDPGVRIGPGAPYLDQNATDPFVIRNPDGSVTAWYFVQVAAGSTFQGANGLYSADSNDGLIFASSVLTGIPGGNPNVIVRADGIRLMFLSANDPVKGPGIRLVRLD